MAYSPTIEDLKKAFPYVINRIAPDVCKHLGLGHISINVLPYGKTPVIKGNVGVTMKKLSYSMIACIRSVELYYAPFLDMEYENGADMLNSIARTLIHELRHVWQFMTGNFFSSGDLVDGTFVIPYEDRWCERDANAFALWYSTGQNGDYVSPEFSIKQINL